MTENKKPNSPDIWNKKPVADEREETITVKVQNMFPNCQKYEPCCKESDYEETMKKVKKIKNYDEMIKNILEDAKIES